MNKADKIFIAIVLLSSLALYASLSYIQSLDADKQKVAIVEYKNREVLRIDMTVDATYTVEATLGTVTIEVKDEQIRVEKETSPYHYCSLQGWVKDTHVPIVCLPNDLLITLQGVEDGDGPDVQLH